MRTFISTLPASLGCGTPERLRRLTVGTEEGGAHLVSVAEAGQARNLAEGSTAGLNFYPSGLDAHLLHRLGRRAARLLDKDASVRRQAHDRSGRF